MAKRYTVKLMSYYSDKAIPETWAVWDRLQRREVSWLTSDKRVVAKQAREMNRAEVA